MNHILRMTLGVILIVTGIFSIWIPFMPGLLLILLGLVLLGNKRAKVAYQKTKSKLKKWLGPKAGRLFIFSLDNVLREPRKRS